MNWEAIGAVGEILSALGVLVTLGYVGFQIRQNTAQLSQNALAVQLSALDANLQAGNRVRELLIADVGLSDLYIKGLEGYAQLDRTERLRFGMLLQNLLGAIQASYLRNAALDLETIAIDTEYGIGRMIDSMFAHKGVREWWERRESGYRPEFAEVINERLARLAGDDKLATSPNPQPSR